MPQKNKTQTGLIEANLPLYIQCLRMPVKWRRATISDRWASADPMKNFNNLGSYTQDGDLLLVSRAIGEAETYDPWEKRSEFFRLQKGDTDVLLAFLQSVGFFDSKLLVSNSKHSTARKNAADGLVYLAEYEPTVSEKSIWGVRRLFEGSVRIGEDIGKHADFTVRIVTVKDNPRLMLTTTNFVDALALTLSIDAVRRAKRRKCARSDCGVPFTYTGGHSRKYCSWYCGHIESVRNSRKRAKKASKAKRQSGEPRSGLPGLNKGKPAPPVHS